MIRYIIIACLAWGLLSCYDDLGNYDYQDINEITVDSVKAFYTIDQFDTLKIEPSLAGTMYSDTSRFNFTWEFDGKVIGTSARLQYKVMNSPGEKYCRLIIEDKENGVKEYCYFNTNVVSTTAVDGILLLSNYNGHGELSFKRVDRENEEFQVNFYNAMNKTYLGTQPQKMVQLYNYELNDANDLFGLQILTDQEVRRVSYKTLMQDTVYPVYNKDYFKSQIPVNPGYPDFGNFAIENISTDELSWMGDFMGPMQRIVRNLFIAEGKYFMIQFSGMLGGVYGLSYLRGSALGGELAPVYCYVSKKKTWSLGFFYDIGYNTSANVIVFDKTYHRFLYGNYAGQMDFQEIAEFRDLDLENYEPVYASSTRNQNNPFVILTNGSNYRCLMLQAPQNDNEYQPGQTTGIKFRVLSDLTIPAGQINQYSNFYCYVTDEDFYFSTGNVLYAANIQSLINGSWSAREICRLTDFDYEAQATINCFDFTRSGKYVALGVSRDGKQKDVSSTDLNGDVLLLNITKTTNAVSLKKKFEHAGGTPVDILMKYLSYFCEGYDENNTFRDFL